MTKTPPKDVGASVRARLSRLARERGEDLQLVLTRYANERLLFRVAASRHAQRFVLKGAALFTLWTIGRPVRDWHAYDSMAVALPSPARSRSWTTSSPYRARRALRPNGPPLPLPSKRSRRRPPRYPIR